MPDEKLSKEEIGLKTVAIHADRARAAAGEIMAAALVGDSFEASLQQLAEATDARGISLTRVHDRRAVAAIASTEWKEPEKAFVAGLAPSSPRRFYPDAMFGEGFVGDTDVWTEEELRRDSYFQEFLRPNGAFFHAKLRLSANASERLTLSLRRCADCGPYDPAEIATLNGIAPVLRTAVRVAQRALGAEASGMARMLHERGDPVVELDDRGRVLHAHCDHDDDFSRAVRGQRLILADSRAQAVLDRAVANAVAVPRQPALIATLDKRGERRFLDIVPVTGYARDVFPSTAALVVVVKPKHSGTAKLPDFVGRSLGLTERERQVATLIAAGFAVTEIAERLHLGPGTARNYLKSIFAKTETRRQGELVAFLLRLQL